MAQGKGKCNSSITSVWSPVPFPPLLSPTSHRTLMPWTLTTEQVSSTSPDGMTKLTMHHVDIMVAHAHVEMEDMETVVLVVEMGDVAVMIELFRAVTWMGEKDGGGGWWLRGESSGRVAV